MYLSLKSCTKLNVELEIIVSKPPAFAIAYVVIVIEIFTSFSGFKFLSCVLSCYPTGLPWAFLTGQISWGQTPSAFVSLGMFLLPPHFWRTLLLDIGFQWAVFPFRISYITVGEEPPSCTLSFLKSKVGWGRKSRCQESARYARVHWGQGLIRQHLYWSCPDSSPPEVDPVILYCQGHLSETSTDQCLALRGTQDEVYTEQWGRCGGYRALQGSCGYSGQQHELSWKERQSKASH